MKSIENIEQIFNERIILEGNLADFIKLLYRDSIYVTFLTYDDHVVEVDIKNTIVNLYDSIEHMNVNLGTYIKDIDFVEGVPDILSPYFKKYFKE